jgi:Abortive infection alpha
MSDDGIRQALGRCLQQFLGPTAEETGQLIADHVRYFRWRSLLKIVERAEKHAKKNNLDNHAIPLKFLVPFVEQASLQDEDANLSEMWSKLLANARDHYRDRYVTFLQILNALGADEAEMLREMWRTAKPLEVFSAWRSDPPVQHLQNNILESDSDIYGFSFNREVAADDFLTDGAVVFFFHEDNVANMNAMDFRGMEALSDLTHLQSLGLVSFIRGSVRTPTHRHYVIVGRITPFGFEFVEACEVDPDER